MRLADLVTARIRTWLADVQDRPRHFRIETVRLIVDLENLGLRPESVQIDRMRVTFTTRDERGEPEVWTASPFDIKGTIHVHDNWRPAGEEAN